MFLRFLPPAFRVAAGRLLLRRLSGSQPATAAAWPWPWSPVARTRRLLTTTTMMRSRSHGSNIVSQSKVMHAMAAAAAAWPAIGSGAWYMGSKMNKQVDDDLSWMKRRLEEEISRPAGRTMPCDSRCGDTYRGFIAAMEGALQRRRLGHDHGGAAAQQSLRLPSSSETEAAAGGGGVSPAPADSRRRRFGFLPRFLFRPPPPSEVDWVEAGAVSPVVRKQNGCGSCWAMPVVGAVEAAHYLKTKQHVSLSVQELVDCDTMSHGCGGGWPGNALEYVLNNGLSAESSYPYMDRRSAMGCCRAEEEKAAAARISDYGFVFPTEGALERAVAKRPVVVTLQSCEELQSYKGGVMEYRAKPYTAARRDGLHGVLMVGYGTDDDGVKYWRFKNSWGEGWGEKGFGRIRRRHGGWRGVAGLCMYPAMYPVID